MDQGGWGEEILHWMAVGLVMVPELVIKAQVTEGKVNVCLNPQRAYFVESFAASSPLCA